MSVEKRVINSHEMERVLRFVKAMTKTMRFDAQMASANWPKARKRNNIFYRLMPKESGVKFEKVQLGNQKAMLATYGNTGEENNIVYFHGGGFVTGSAFVTQSYCSMLAKYSGCKVYSIDYSLAPEKPYPAGFNDCCEAFETLMKQYPEAGFSLIGESAGGNFALTVALKYKASRRISSVTAHSATVDFSGVVDHSINENKDIIVKRGTSKPMREIYVKGYDPKDPLLSPYYGDFAGFPPVFITCDVNETLYADSKALYECCMKAGVETKMIEVEGGYHAFAISGTNTPETTRILEENIEFMKKYSRK